MTAGMVYAQTLLECLRTALNEGPNPPPDGNICLRFGEEVAPMLSTARDECCEGLAWVRVVETNPRLQPEDIGARCLPMLERTTLEMGVARCHATPGPDELVSCDQWTAEALQADADHEAMRKALCCLWSTDGLPGDPEVYPGVYTPTGPDGNCVAGTYTVIVDHGCGWC